VTLRSYRYRSGTCCCALPPVGCRAPWGGRRRWMSSSARPWCHGGDLHCTTLEREGQDAEKEASRWSPRGRGRPEQGEGGGHCPDRVGSRDRWGLGLGLVGSPSAKCLIYVVGEPGARLAGLGWAGPEWLGCSGLFGFRMHPRVKNETRP
jgi:hypothetical protein